MPEREELDRGIAPEEMVDGVPVDAAADRRGGGPAERGQVDVGEPDRRAAARRSSRSTRASPGTARSSSPSGPATTSGSWTPGGWLKSDEALAKQITYQAERAMARWPTSSSSSWTSPSGRSTRTRRSRRSCSASGKPVLLVANKVDDPNRENDVWEFIKLGLGDPHAVSAIHGRQSGDMLDALVAELPEDLPVEVRRVHDGTFSIAIVGPARTSASRRSSTGWSATTALSCTTCPARRWTPSTPSSRHPTVRCGSWTPRGCAGRARSRSRPSTRRSCAR